MGFRFGAHVSSMEALLSAAGVLMRIWGPRFKATAYYLDSRVQGFGFRARALNLKPYTQT